MQEAPREELTERHYVYEVVLSPLSPAPKGSSTFKSSATSWGPSVPTREPRGDFFFFAFKLQYGEERDGRLQAIHALHCFNFGSMATVQNLIP